MFTERMDVRVEVEDSHVLLVFPKKLDDFMTPRQEAWTLGETLELAAGDIPNPGIAIASEVQMQSDQVKLNTHKDCVVLMFDRTDRIKLCKEATVLVARAIKKKAQDLDYVHKGVRFLYGKRGLLKGIHNDKTGITLVIPGRK